MPILLGYKQPPASGPLNSVPATWLWSQSLHLPASWRPRVAMYLLRFYQGKDKPFPPPCQAGTAWPQVFLLPILWSWTWTQQWPSFDSADENNGLGNSSTQILAQRHRKASSSRTTCFWSCFLSLCTLRSLLMFFKKVTKIGLYSLK